MAHFGCGGDAPEWHFLRLRALEFNRIIGLSGDKAKINCSFRHKQVFTDEGQGRA